MSPRPWPYPGDMAADRAKRIAIAYRRELEKVDPDACQLLDDQFANMAESWMLPTLALHDPDDWVRIEEAALMVGRGTSAIHKWIQRKLLPSLKDDAGRSIVRVGDVLDVAAQFRRKRSERNAA